MMDPILVRLIGHLFVKATLVLGGAWIATHFLSRSSVAKRHAVWSLAMALLLLIPLLTPLLPAWAASRSRNRRLWVLPEAPAFPLSAAVHSRFLIL